jgi:flagellar biosynthetic protein FliR
MIKAGLTILLTILLLIVLEPVLPSRPESEVALAIMLLNEMIVGFLFGWIARVIMISLPMAGQMIADFTGLSNVLLPSPELGSQAAAMARLYEVALPTLVLSSGLYRTLLSAMVAFYHLIPPGAAASVPDTTALVIAVTAETFHLAIRLTGPFIVLAVAWNLGLGLITRMVPRLQVFFVALPGQIAVGLLLIAAMAAPIVAAWSDAVELAFHTLSGGG